MAKNHPGKHSANHTGAKTAVAIGAGIAAVAAISYFFFGPSGENRRRKLKGWMIKMKGEIIQEIESSEHLTEAAYHDIVDTAAAAYRTAVNPSELHKFVANLKRHWKKIKQEAEAKKGKTAK